MESESCGCSSIPAPPSRGCRRPSPGSSGDTGSTFTWVPETLARELGARVIRPVSLRVADNRTVERTLGELEVEIQGRMATRLVVFGHETDMPLLGADTLEGLLFEVDPVEGKLRPLSYALAV